MITLFAVLLRFAGGGVFQRLGPTCRLAFCPPRVSSSRGLSTGGAFGFGFWGLAPRTSRAVRSVGPAKAFAHRAESDSPAMTALSFGPFSGSFSGLWPPLLEPIRPWAFRALPRRTCRVSLRHRACPQSVLRGRRPADPAVFPLDPLSRLRFFAVRLTSTGIGRCVTQRGLF